jgi:PIN domain nuclease of toxin-antitoxin system
MGCGNMILLDTHVLVWLAEGSARLGKKARKKLDEALKEGALYVSTISFWEVAMLKQKGRLELGIDMAAWRSSLLENELRELAVSGEIAIQAAGLENFLGDPADRLIAASALVSGATLCTADTQILSWSRKLSLLDANK